MKIIEEIEKWKELNKPKKDTFTFTRHYSFQDFTNCLIEGIKTAYQDCPNSENMTFEEVANWTGGHVLITEQKP